MCLVLQVGKIAVVSRWLMGNVVPLGRYHDAIAVKVAVVSRWLMGNVVPLGR